jgi:hypothetical protein
MAPRRGMTGCECVSGHRTQADAPFAGLRWQRAGYRLGCVITVY